MNDETDVLVVGAGYLGSRVAQFCLDQISPESVQQVYATTRGGNRLKSLSARGFSAVQYDWTDPSTFGNLPLAKLSRAARVLISVSYDRRAGRDRYDSQVGGMRNLLRVLPPDSRICYISTTGVYHQTDGPWVDETSATHPNRVGGRVHLQAERLLHSMRPTSPWTILRLAGIYGPGRVPRAADVLAGRPIASPESGYLNLIHVADAVRSVWAAWNQLSSIAARTSPDESSDYHLSRLFVVADDQPVIRGDFYREIARQCQAKAPQFTLPAPDAPVLMRSNSNKRVWNRKLRRELLPLLDFPNYRCGLADILRAPVECPPTLI